MDFLLAKLPPVIVLRNKISTHQPTRHRIYADSSHPTPDTSLSNTDCKLPSTADSTFESALIGGIRQTVRVNVSTYLPTAVGRLSFLRLVGRFVVKIGMCVLSISIRFFRFYNRKDTGSIMKRIHSYLYTHLFMFSLNNNYK